MAAHSNWQVPFASWLAGFLELGDQYRSDRKLLQEVLASTEFALGVEEFLFLWICTQHQHASSQRVLAEMMGISTSQTSLLAEKLRRREWIAVAQSTDRRRQTWQLTAAGRHVVADVVEKFAAKQELHAARSLRIFSAKPAGGAASQRGEAA